MLHILTVAWGDYHVEMLKRACLRSLKSPKNKAAIEEQETFWTIYTDEKHIDDLRAYTRKLFPSVIFFIKDMSELRRYTDAAQSAIVEAAEQCLKDKAPLLFAPPDIFFGDGSVQGFLKVGFEQDSVVVAAHPRVRPEVLLEPISTSNAELVTFSWKHLHRSWTDAEVGHPRQNSFIGGVAWQKVDDNLYSVVHRLPTPYLIHFTDEDLKYFKLQNGFGHFDHMWPGDILIPRGRQRYIGSSDIAFMIEITDPHKNIPPVGQGSPNDFWRHHVHNEVDKGICVTFRGA